METDSRPLTADALPERLADIFRLLKTGRHLCADDGLEYRDLRCNEDTYRVLFGALGYELVSHGQGFFYFKGSKYLSTKRLKAITLFMFILFQDLEEKKFQEADRAWERKLLMRTFKIAELPHFDTSPRRSILSAVGVSDVMTLRDIVLLPMERMGMLATTAKGEFEFRAPIYRFVDLCMQFSGATWGTNTNAQSSRSDAPADPEMKNATMDVEDHDPEENSV
jgi:hypothetical protein